MLFTQPNRTQGNSQQQKPPAIFVALELGNGACPPISVLFGAGWQQGALLGLCLKAFSQGRGSFQENYVLMYSTSLGPVGISSVSD